MLLCVSSVRSHPTQKGKVAAHSLQKLTGRVKWKSHHFCFLMQLFAKLKIINPLRPNNDLSHTSPCNIKGLSVSEVLRIENMITEMNFY